MAVKVSKLSKFSGTGTVFLTGTPRLDASMAKQPPELVIKAIRDHLDAVSGLIETHGGTIVQFLGDSVLAFWHPGTSHAQSAFDAARKLLEIAPTVAPNRGPVFHTAIALGTGALGGDFFGPTKQFQIVGTAVSTAQRLSQLKPLPGSFIRMSQHTATIVDAPGLMREQGFIERPGLDALEVYSYRRGS